MFDRENAVGLLLLGLCIVVGGVLVYSISTGTRFQFTGPGWLGIALMVGFVVLIGYGLVAGGGLRRFRGLSQWPDPSTGRRPWWRRGQGRDEGDGERM